MEDFFVKIISAAVTVVPHIIEAFIKLRTRKIFLASATCDPLGVVNIIIENHSEKSLPLKSVVLLKDKSRFKYFLRKIFALDRIVKFDVVEWSTKPSLPSEIGSDDMVKLFAEINVKSNDHQEISKMYVTPLLIKLQLGRYSGIYKLKYTNEYVLTDDDITNDV